MRPILLPLAAAAALAGCTTVGPDWQAPAAPDIQRYAEGPDTEVQPAPANWWRLFDSPVLDGLVAQALAHSATLAQADAQLREAALQADALDRDLRGPQADGQLSVQRQHNEPAANGIAGLPASTYRLVGASVSVRYALDLFGGDRRRLESAAAQLEQMAHRRDAARAAVAGNVVTAALQAARLQALIDGHRQLLALQAQTVAIVSRRLAAGSVAEAELRAAEQQQAAADAAVTPLQRQLAGWQHRLGALLGRLPADGLPPLPPADALALPADLPLGLPSTLTRRRPDVRAAEAAWHGARAQIGVARAERFPSLQLTAGFSAEQARNGGRIDGFSLWNLGGNLAQPLLRQGALKAREQAAGAAQEAAQAAYRDTVERAFVEVADALQALQADRQALQAATRVDGDAAARRTIAAARFAAGGISRLELLDAERQQLQAGLDRLAARIDVQLDGAALLMAVGGPLDDGPLQSAAAR